MDNQEKHNEKKKPESCCDAACSGQTTGSDTLPNCCEQSAGLGDCSGMMAGCMKKCRWFPLIPVAMGVLFMLLGYCLDVKVARVLWMILGGLVMLMGALGFIMMSAMKRAFNG